MKATHNRVWIELDRPANKQEGELRCQLLNQMMRKLGCDFEVFWYNERQCCYCVNMGPGGAGYYECSDNGHWFNLDMLAK